MDVQFTQNPQMEKDLIPIFIIGQLQIQLQNQALRDPVIEILVL